MERSIELLELLNTLIKNTTNNKVILNKSTLQSMVTCLQVSQEKVQLFQAQSQLLNDEICNLKNQESMKQSEQVFLHHNPLFDDDNNDYNQHSVQTQFSEPTLEKNEDEDEGIHEPTVHAFSFKFNEENISKIQQHAKNQPQMMSKKQLRNDLYKPIIRPWEEIRYNK